MRTRSFGTHDGSFHADEVTACALLLLFDLIDYNLIVRSRDLNLLQSCEYVCDVGGVYDPIKKRFDHHQVSYTGDLSSAGMVLMYLKEIGIISEDLYNYFNNSVVIGVDAVDNGKEAPKIGYCSFSSVIQNYSPIEYGVEKEVTTKAFLEAVNFTVGHFQRLRDRFIYMQSCKQYIAKVMKKQSTYLIFDRPMPWLDSFFSLQGESHPALFIIMPTGNHWKLRTIPLTRDAPMSMRQPLPESWAGLMDAELQRVSGISGAIFCHKNRFISIWETQKDAIQALHSILGETL